MNIAPYPLLLEPIYKAKIWGGRTLEKLGRKLPGDEKQLIGESWELADLGQSSPGGGGGGAERSVIANGAMAGKTLHEAIAQWGDRLLGRLRLNDRGEFPLLAKFLDARQNLSVQVHPSPVYALTHPDAHLKSEAWYILHAEPHSVIYKGVREGVEPSAFRQAVEAGDRPAVEAMLIAVPAKAGECHYLPSGTCHALGAGILVAEVQTPSDTTFRVYDWGRPAAAGRPLHLDQAMECIEFGPPNVKRAERRSHIAGAWTTVSRLITCDHFRIERIRMSEGYEQEIPYDQLAVWTVIQGQGILSPGLGQPDVPFSQGQTLLVPAHSQAAQLKLLADTVWLEVTFPQVLAEQIA